jgi:hypothetical protein
MRKQRGPIGPPRQQTTRGGSRRVRQRPREARPAMVSDVVLLDVAPNPDSRAASSLGSLSDLGLVDQAPGASLSGRFPRVSVTDVAERWGRPNTGRRCQEYYPSGPATPPRERRRTTRRAGARPSHRAPDLNPVEPEAIAEAPKTKRQHSERWARALSKGGIPVCWVCDTRNSAEARDCCRCGQRLVSKPGLDSSSSVGAIAPVSSPWRAVHTVCIAAVLFLASGFLLLA